MTLSCMLSYSHNSQGHTQEVTSQVWQKTGSECCVNVFIPSPSRKQELDDGFKYFESGNCNAPPSLTLDVKFGKSGGTWQRSGFRLRTHKFGSDIYGKSSGNKNNSNRKWNLFFPIHHLSHSLDALDRVDGLFRIQIYPVLADGNLVPLSPSTPVKTHTQRWGTWQEVREHFIILFLQLTTIFLIPHWRL